MIRIWLVIPTPTLGRHGKVLWAGRGNGSKIYLTDFSNLLRWDIREFSQDPAAPGLATVSPLPQTER